MGAGYILLAIAIGALSGIAALVMGMSGWTALLLYCSTGAATIFAVLLAALAGEFVFRGDAPGPPPSEAEAEPGRAGEALPAPADRRAAARLRARS